MVVVSNYFAFQVKNIWKCHLSWTGDHRSSCAGLGVSINTLIGS